MKNISIALVFIAILVGSVVAFSGCTLALSCEDRSRQQLERCNTDCGEGLGAALCKSTCTSEHNARLEQCKEQPY